MILGKKLYSNLLLLFLSAILFIPFLGLVHLFDWDEINFAECAREMLVSGNYNLVQINYSPFWEKPPLFIWMQALSMNIFGINELAARLPNALCGIVTLLLLFNIGKKMHGNSFGLIWCMAFAGSLLPHFYFRSGIIDPWFNLFIFLGIYFISNYTHTKKNTANIFMAGVSIGLAILTKGPVALLIVFLCAGIFMIIKRFKTNFSVMSITVFLLVTMVIGGSWFIQLYFAGKSTIIHDFIDYQVRLFRTEDSDHGGPFFYHFIVLFFGCFPASVFAIIGFSKNENENSSQQHFKIWMIILLFVTLILFSIVKTKIIHYSSLCYFPLTYLATYAIQYLLSGSVQWKKWMSICLMISGGLISAAIAILPFVGIFKNDIIKSGIIQDKFAEANLGADVVWNRWEWIPGVILFTAIIYFIIQIKKQQITKALYWLFASSIFTIVFTTFIFVPKIEKYTQSAAIEFFISLQGKDCYIGTIDYKSYAHYYYGQMPQPSDSLSLNTNLLGPTSIDKPAYFSAKISAEDNIKKNHPYLKELYRKNGFIFYLREPSK